MPIKVANEALFYRAQVGELIWCWRQERKMNQTELARKAGLSRPQVSAIENGHSNGSFDSIRQIAAALGVSLADLTPKEKGKE